MTNFASLEWTVKPQTIKQSRTYVLCICKLPNEVRERMTREQVRKSHGAFLVAFSAFPTVGESFPFEGQFWQVKQINQFPHRYKSRGNRYPAIALLEWTGSYENIQDVIETYLELGEES